jgi:outer membrane immunogenic protein
LIEDLHSRTRGYYDGVTAYYSSRDNTRTGWVAGGGVEYAFTPNFTGRIEGLYVNLERSRGVFPTTLALPAYTGRRNEDSFAVIRAGLNYKFSSY